MRRACACCTGKASVRCRVRACVWLCARKPRGTTRRNATRVERKRACVPAERDDVAEREQHREGGGLEDDEPGLRERATAGAARVREGAIRRGMQCGKRTTGCLAPTHHDAKHRAHHQASGEADEALRAKRTHAHAEGTPRGRAQTSGRDRLGSDERVYNQRCLRGTARRTRARSVTHLLLGQRAHLVQLLNHARRLRLNANLGAQRAERAERPP